MIYKKNKLNNDNSNYMITPLDKVVTTKMTDTE